MNDFDNIIGFLVCDSYYYHIINWWNFGDQISLLILLSLQTRVLNYVVLLSVMVWYHESLIIHKTCESMSNIFIDLMLSISMSNIFTNLMLSITKNYNVALLLYVSMQWNYLVELSGLISIVDAPIVFAIIIWRKSILWDSDKVNFKEHEN